MRRTQTLVLAFAFAFALAALPALAQDRTDLQPLPASNLNISHALQNIYFWSQEDAQQPAGD